MAQKKNTASNDIVLKGFLDTYNETAELLGIIDSRNSKDYPQQVYHGDYISVYLDDARTQPFIEGYLLIDSKRLETEEAYSDLQRNQYAQTPFYLFVNNMDMTAVKLETTRNPRSNLALDIAFNPDMLKPAAVTSLFYQQLPAIIIRSARTEQKRLAQLDADKVAEQKRMDKIDVDAPTP